MVSFNLDTHLHHIFGTNQKNINRIYVWHIDLDKNWFINTSKTRIRLVHNIGSAQ